MKISCDTFYLKDWEITDAPSLVFHANNKKIRDNLRDGFPHPYTKSDALAYIKFCQTTTTQKSFAIEVDNCAVGTIGLIFGDNIYAKNAEIGYWIGEAYWGKGIMTLAVKRVVQYGFETLQFHRIFAKAFVSNIATVKVLEKAGFKEEGYFKEAVIKNGVIGDEYLFAIRNNLG